MEILWHTAERTPLRSLFALAEDSPQRLEASIDRGRVLVARDNGQIAGYLQLVDSGTGEAELGSMAVAEQHQGKGFGRALVLRAIAECRSEGIHTLLVATASADIGNLRFYQRLDFRMLRIERDAFTAADGYADELSIDGIPVRDRVWLALTLHQPARPRGEGAPQRYLQAPD